MEDEEAGPLLEHGAGVVGVIRQEEGLFSASLELAHGVVIMNVERFEHPTTTTSNKGAEELADDSDLFKAESSSDGEQQAEEEEEEEEEEEVVEEEEEEGGEREEVASGGGGVVGPGNLPGDDDDQGLDYLGLRAAGVEEEEEEEEEEDEEEEEEEDERVHVFEDVQTGHRGDSVSFVSGSGCSENQGEAQQRYGGGDDACGLGCGTGGFEYGEYSGTGELIPNAAGGQEAQERLGRVGVHQEHYQELEDDAPAFNLHGPYARGGGGQKAGDDVPSMGCSIAPKMLPSIFNEDAHGKEEERSSVGDGGAIGFVSLSHGQADGAVGKGGEEEDSEEVPDPCAVDDDNVGDGLAASPELLKSQPSPLRNFNKIQGFDDERILESCGDAEDGNHQIWSLSEEPVGEAPSCTVADAGRMMEDSQKLLEDKGTPSSTTTTTTTRGKGGRVSRELGALLDAHMGRPGRARKQSGSKDFSFHGEGSTSDPADDGNLAEGFRFQNETGRIRVTRSRATVMFRHSQGTDPEPACPKGVVDVPGKKTGKRSMGRGGRQGWGNIVTIHAAEDGDIPVPAMNGGLEGPHVDSILDPMTEAQGSVEGHAVKKKAKGIVKVKKKGRLQQKAPASTEGEVSEPGAPSTVQKRKVQRRGKNQRGNADGKGTLNRNEIDQSVSPSFPTLMEETGGKSSWEGGLKPLEVEKLLESSSMGNRQNTGQVCKDMAQEAEPLDNVQLLQISHLKDVHSSGQRNKQPETLASGYGQFKELRVRGGVGFLGQETTSDGKVVKFTGASRMNGTALSAEEQGFGEERDLKVKKLDNLGWHDDADLSEEGEEKNSALIRDRVPCLSRVLKEACDELKEERNHNLSAGMAGNKTEAGNDKLGLSTCGDGSLLQELGQPPSADAENEGEEEPVDVGKAALANVQVNSVHMVEAVVKPVKTSESGEKEEGGVGETTEDIAKEEYSNQRGKSCGVSGEDADSVTSWDPTMHKSFGNGDGSMEDITGKVTDAGGTKAQYEQVGAASETKLPMRNRKEKLRQAAEPQDDVCSAGKAKKSEARHRRTSHSKNHKAAVGKHVVEKESPAEDKAPLKASEGHLMSHEIAKTTNDLAPTGKASCKQWNWASQVVDEDEHGSLQIRKCNTPVTKPLAAARKRELAVEAPVLGKQGGHNSGGTNKSRRKEQPEATVTKNYTAGGNHTGDKALSFEKDLAQGEGEGSTHLAENAQSTPVKQVKEEIGRACADSFGSLKAGSSAGALGDLARDTESVALREEVSSGVTEGVTNTRDKVDDSAATTPRASWVLCDNCQKWRCIPVDLADEIDVTNRFWSCSDNPNKEFADCSIPQEKSDAEINRELEISENSLCDEEDDTDATGDKPMEDCTQENRPAVWTLIPHNIFNHRSRKHQDPDEAMVCQCKTPVDGEVACGENCLNRMLSIECLSQQCPCGTKCSNQQFQRGAYIQVQRFRCGKKGFGLKVMENVCKDSFIIEYVGEVLNIPAYEARQKEYAVKGQKHFYFMSLSSTEVIDACSKGNLGRFINHSCEPNCRTEKWTVDGEVCIGLFANRDLIEGEEITFNYNYERVGGAVAKKCECGSANCRGFIGGDPDTPRIVVEYESDEDEDLEPIMLQADDIEEHDYSLDGSKVGQLRKAQTASDGDAEDLKVLKTQGLKRKAFPAGAKEGKGSVKRVKTTSVPKRSGAKTAQSKGLTINVSSNIRANGAHAVVRNMHYSEVEEKLGEMSDSRGGLRNRRDAAKQYLKLLVLTATSGDSVNGTAACSMRDLSLLLEGLLQTNKGAVLKDIMNKNGLQIFHNLIKQFRRQWEKIPILRKLLKVLEHLAIHKVLTVEHIYANPPRDGIESFSDSLYELSKHKNAEVHTMARRFRRNYVPPRPQCMDLQNGNGYRHSLSPIHSQPSDQSKRAREQQHMPSPSNVQSDRSVCRSGQQQPSSLLAIEHGLESGPKPPPFVESFTCKTPQVQEAKQEDLPSQQDPISEAINDSQPVRPVTTKRKRPSRWDTPKSTHGPDTGAATIDPATAAILSTSGAADLVCQAPRSSSSGCDQQVTSLEVSNFKSQGQVTKLPVSDSESGCPQHEASPGHLGCSQEQDSKTLASAGSLQTAWSSSEASTPTTSALTTKCSLVEAPAGTPRPPPGPPPPGQPSVHASISPLSQATVGNSSAHQQMVIVPGQSAMPAQIFMGVPGQMPVVTHLPPGPVHMGMQVIQLGNGMAVVTHAPNLFASQPPATLVPAPSGAPPRPTPMHAGIPQMSLARAPPLPFGFPPGPPSQGVPQPVPIVPAASYVPWQMQPSGQAPFAGQSSLMISGQPRPPAPSWPKSWSSQQTESWGHGSAPGRESGREASRASEGQSGSSCSKVVHSESQGLELEPEPPVPGLSPVGGSRGLDLQRNVQRGGALAGPSQGANCSRESKQPDTAQYGTVGPTTKKEDTAKSLFNSSTGARPPKEPTSRSHADHKELHTVHNRTHQSWHPQGSGEEASRCTENPVCNSRQRRDYTVDESGAIVSWETPECSSFEQHVSTMVRYRVGSHHKTQLKDTERLCSKLTEDVVKKEIKKYQDNRIQGTMRSIQKSRLLDKVNMYVDMQVQMYNQKKSISDNRH